MSKYSIEVIGLSVSYGKKRVLANIYLDILPGYIYGLIGPNGAGKSTLMKAILGLEQTSSGSVRIHGKHLEESRPELAYVPQKDEIDWTFPANVMDVVMMGRYPHKKLFSKINKHDKNIANEAVETLGIEDLVQRQIGQLSGGQQQRVFLARALCSQANSLLREEPFVGVDLTTEEKIIGVLKQLASEGKTLLVVHHDLSSVKAYFNKVILLNQRLIAYGDVEQTFNEENIAKTYGAQLTLLHKTGMAQQ